MSVLPQYNRKMLSWMSRLLVVTVGSAIGVFVFATAIYFDFLPLVKSGAVTELKSSQSKNPYWQAPPFSEIPTSEEGALIRYGKELIYHTAIYLGPKGKVKPISNGMNCKNCHLEGGTKTFGLNYSAVAANYPQMRDRSNTLIDIEDRINECIERSLNGTRLEEGDRELEAISAYLLWIGKNVPQNQIPNGSGMKKLVYLERSADPINGKQVYDKHCIECHGANSEGEMEPNGLEWKYPPLFGEHSYNSGAGLLRLSKFASFVKYNMPFGVTHDAPLLSDEEAWDVAAYVNSLPRPGKDISGDWPDISKKPIDHPFGPYLDDWSETRHKYGPFTR